MTDHKSIVKRWTNRLSIRKALRHRAAVHHDRVHNKASRELLEHRKDQVAFAERVIARHEVIPTTLRERALDQAELALARHIFETGGNNRGPAVEQIIAYAGGDIGEPWCVDFVIWCYGHAGSNIVKPGWYRAVRYMINTRTYSAGKQSARPGDAVRYTFDHTGLFCYYSDAKGHKVSAATATHIVTIEGNTGSAGAVSDGNGHDGVYRKVRSLSLVRDFVVVPD